MLAAITLGVSRLWWPSEVVQPWMIAVGLGGVALAVGSVAGLLRPVLDERELALLVDRALGTDEVLVTLLHLEEEGQAPPAVQSDLERRVAALSGVGSGVASGPPRHAWLVPVGAIVAALLLLIPQRPDAVRTADTDQTEIEEEAERLEDALEEIEQEHAEALPDELQDQLDSLMDDLNDDALTPEEAQARIEQLQEELAEWEKNLEESSGGDADALEEAADALREADMEDEATEAAMEELADALEDTDLEGAAGAVEDLMEQLEGASAADQQKLGEALERAGEAMKGASSEELKAAGDALQQAGQDMQDQAGEGEGENGEPNGDGTSARERLEDLREQLQNAEGLQERLQSDAEKLKKSQEMNGALEASRQRMGGEAEVAQGEQGEDAQVGQGQGQGQGLGEPSTGLDAPIGVGEGGSQGSQPGGNHTWEDEGTFDTTQGHQDENRLSDRTAGEHVDDFEAFYDPVRMADAEGLITSVQGQLDESGHIDSLPTRRTQGDETAARKLLDVPDQYIDAADEAVNNERVPPGYRAAVKDYFDTME